MRTFKAHTQKKQKKKQKETKRNKKRNKKKKKETKRNKKKQKRGNPFLFGLLNKIDDFRRFLKPTTFRQKHSHDELPKQTLRLGPFGKTGLANTFG